MREYAGALAVIAVRRFWLARSGRRLAATLFRQTRHREWPTRDIRERPKFIDEKIHHRPGSLRPATAFGRNATSNPMFVSLQIFM